MKLRAIAAPEFNLGMTLDSGQVFHWERHAAGFAGTIGDLALYVEQSGRKLKFAGSETPAAARPVATTVARYFALDHPLREICASFPDDVPLKAAREFCHGLRIIRQPKWECLATFICSSMKQVAHIRQICLALRKCFGQPQEIYGHRVYAFPTVSRIAGATEKQLRRCALGYRARNLRATAQRLAGGKADLEAWSALPDAELRERLCALPGVGPKVANCVMLFAYERLSAFPIDVWIERVLREKYFAASESVPSRALREFAANYFGANGGYAQQYLFHHARITKLRARSASRPQPGRRSNAGA